MKQSHDARLMSETFQINGFWDPLDLPKSFDARAKWYKCPSLGQIYDQGNCRASHAVSVASAVSDRICIHTDGAQKPKLSAQQIISCCYLCGNGCGRSGRHYDSWDFYRRHGLVSGGGYGSDEVSPRFFNHAGRSSTLSMR